ncbi:MAG: amino acid adenylation domain-containing protein [Herpetosiphonaceae bacterium]|nr:amino acid adenylation domain-containing protein [Herpetosiphonaceae bacterium]
MNSVTIEHMYPLSPTQQGMLFHTLQDQGGGVYFIQSCLGLQGQINIQEFEAAWERLVSRHPALRTSFHWEGLDQPLQVVHSAVDLPLTILDWSDLAPEQRDERLATFLEADRQRPFDLAIAPLFRLTLIAFGADSYHLVWSLHHIVLDGWSVSLVYQELFAQLLGGAAGDPRVGALPAPPYARYIAWLERQDHAAAQRFWRGLLAGITTPTPLLIEQPDCAAIEEREIRELHQRYDPAFTQALQDFAQQERLTLSTLVHGAWALALRAYSGEDDVLFGSVTSGRSTSLPEAEKMIGMLLTTLPVRATWAAETPLRQWLADLQRQIVERRQFEYSPLVDVHGWSDVPRGLPLFESLLVFENYPLDDLLRGGAHGLRTTSVKFITPTNYPLTIQAMFTPELTLSVSYDAARFTEATAARVLAHVQAALQAMVTDPGGQVGGLDLLPPAEQHLLRRFNQTPPPPPLDRPISSYIAEHAVARPDAVALRCGEAVLTYPMLHSRTNQLARWLLSSGLPKGTRVGVFAERDIEMAVVLLACLQAGYAYTPLNPVYPDSRLQQILADSTCAIIATTLEFVERIRPLAQSLPHAPIMYVWDSSTPSDIAALPATALPEDVPGHAIATIFYTSGSTGVPKGAMVESIGLLNHLWAKIQVLDMTASSRVAHTAAHSFDISIWQFLAALMVGGEVVIYPTELVLTPLALFQALQADGVTIIETVPTLLEAFLTALELNPNSGLHLRDLQYLISNAELLPAPLSRRWFAAFPAIPLLNTYGATECSDDTTHIVMTSPLSERTVRVPVGTPIAGFAIYVLDQQLRPLPIGCPGQIAMAGVGVGQGYLGDAAKTARAFVANPFDEYPASRLYLTGDLGRWREDGQLDFLGRTDGQVKLRGHRVELGEVEAALARCPGVRHCVAIVRPDTRQQLQLLGYVVGVPELDIRQIRQDLARLVPPYMVPDHLIVLEAMPLNPNGKIDRRALPLPGLDPPASIALEPPQTPLEELVATTWCDVLALPAIGRHANFFECGGHSLLATQIIARLRQTLELDLPLRALFEHPTVAELSTHIMRLRQRQAPEIQLPLLPVARNQALPLSFAQQRLWIVDQLVRDQPLYTMPTVLRITGPLDQAALHGAFAALIERHESLRTHIVVVDGEPVQVISDRILAPLASIDLRDRVTSAHAAASAHLQRLINAPFDLSTGPLVRAQVLQLADDEHILALALHHIITDGWSTSLVIRDLMALYEAAMTGTAAQLPALTVQYADFAVWQRSWLGGPQGSALLERQLDYWRHQLADMPRLLALPTDRPRPSTQSFHGAMVAATFPAALTAALRQLSRECGTTLFMTLLGGYQTLLALHSGQNDILVGVPIAGRTDPLLEDLIGFFVNTLVLRTAVDRRQTVRELLGQVREVTLDAYDHQDVPFEHLVEILQPERTLSHTPIYQVAFALQNTPHHQGSPAGLTLELVREGDLGVAKFDLMFSLRETADGRLDIVVEYSTDLFDPATIERMVAQYQQLLQAMAADPDQPLAAITLLTPAEQHLIIHELNQTAQAYSPAPLPVLVAQQAARTPAALAICAGAERRTYQELVDDVHRMAQALHKHGVRRGDRIGILMQRHIDLIPTLLAVQAAGAAYVPLDPTYPNERLMVMVNDANLRMVIADPSLLERLPTQVSMVDRQALAAESATQSAEPIDLGLTLDDLAYVIYTSGSTGRPKGIAIPHRGLSAFVDWTKTHLDLQDFCGVVASTSVCFDLSIFEFFAPLVVGGTVILVENGLHMPPPDHQPPATMVNLVPSVMAEVLQQGLLPATVRTINLGGEAATQHLVNQIHAQTAVTNLYNLYGPTEDTVYSTWCRLEAGQPIMIGRPITNTQAYVLDSALRPVPIGVIGSLYLGGDGQAWGYLGKPAQTAEAFVPHPFSQRPGSRLYQTGDLARMRADFSIEYLGRADSQVKIRGFRVELGDIETTLLQHPAVAQAAAAAHKQPDLGMQLVAYIAAKPGQTPEPAALSSYLQTRLPGYMIPSAFVLLERLPLTLNGKIDRRQLPAPDETLILREPYVAPGTATEASLAAIWAELLGIEQIGTRDNFFLLGGHSLLATQLLAHVHSRLGANVALRTFFEAPTVAAMAEHIDTLLEAVSAEEDAILLDQIESLSDEDVAALLARLSS